jgi:hypothetical protein
MKLLSIDFGYTNLGLVFIEFTKYDKNIEIKDKLNELKRIFIQIQTNVINIINIVQVISINKELAYTLLAVIDTLSMENMNLIEKCNVLISEISILQLPTDDLISQKIRMTNWYLLNPNEGCPINGLAINQTLNLIKTLEELQKQHLFDDLDYVLIEKQIIGRFKRALSIKNTVGQYVIWSYFVSLFGSKVSTKRIKFISPIDKLSFQLPYDQVEIDYMKKTIDKSSKYKSYKANKTISKSTFNTILEREEPPYVIEMLKKQKLLKCPDIADAYLQARAFIIKNIWKMV